MSDFAATVREFSVKAKKNMDRQVRDITLSLFSDVIRMSPVGNPELWAENTHNVTLRNAYKSMADALNAVDDGQKKISTSRATLNRQFGKIKRPKGYRGGRFRANWQCTVGVPAMGEVDRIDPSGDATVDAVRQTIGGAGVVTFLANNLAYGPRLEYDGWSKHQAPQGMVRIAMARIDSYVAELK